MLTQSCNENNESNQSFQLGELNSDDVESLKLKIFCMIESLKKAKELNLQLQAKEYDNYCSTQKRIEKHQNLLVKLKVISTQKPKKKIKYANYSPLDRFYFYTEKKTHLYFNLLERVFQSVKHGAINSEGKTAKNNRFSFTKAEDSALLNLIIANNNKNINWCKICEDINQVINTNKNVTENDNYTDKKSNVIFNDAENSFNDSINSNGSSFSPKKKPHKSSKIKVYSPLNCYVRYLELTNFFSNSRWSQFEDKILKKAILYYGPKNWQQISYCLDGRNNSQCFHRWMKGINPKIKREKWTFEEDLKIGLALTKIYGHKKWSKVANHLEDRTDIQCRERWCNILDPSLEEVEWNQDEDDKLLNLYKKIGNKWSLIAKEFGNRTDNTCWRRWKILTLKEK